MQNVDTHTAILGAGVLGLAVAAEIGGDTIVIERHASFGNETSSRNSEVIHSGIYYPRDSQKTRACLEGRELLYEFCERHSVAAPKIGKSVVAVDEAEEAYLEKLLAHARALGVPCEWKPCAEPLVRAKRALFFRESGIVDSHGFMAKLEAFAREKGVVFAYRHRLVGVEPGSGSWSLDVEAPEGALRVRARRVVNCAGLSAAKIARWADPLSPYEHRFCRGRYLSLSPGYHGKFKTLVYPVPPKDGLGVHVTVDTAGAARLGPDVDWTTLSDEQDPRLYDCDWAALVPEFVAAARRYLPSIRAEDLSPGFIGVRAKLFREGVAHPDFVLSQNGVAHTGQWIDSLGIESPGLTSSLSLARSIGERLL